MRALALATQLVLITLTGLTVQLHIYYYVLGEAEGYPWYEKFIFF